MINLRHYGLTYLATPYTKFPGGIEPAFLAAAHLAARLLKAGVSVYSPIAHTHPIALAGELDPLDHSLWLPFDETMMERANVLAVAMLPTWETSYGIAQEIRFFERHRKPVVYLDPQTLIVAWTPERVRDLCVASARAGAAVDLMREASDV